MVELWVPYGDVEVSVRVPEENLAWLADPRQADPKDMAEVVRASLSSPLGSRALKDLVTPGSKIAVAVDGPQGHFSMNGVLELLLDELRNAGVSTNDVDVIAATGAHSIIKGQVDGIASSLKAGKIASNDPRDGEFDDLGTTSFGTKVQINRSFARADLKIIVSSFAIDWLSGYKGGPTCIMPGICNYNSLVQNSRLALQRDAIIGPANLQKNPVYLDSRESATMAGVTFSLIVLPDREGRIHAAFSGSPEESFERAADMASKIYLYRAPERVDLLLVGAGGRPSDSSLLDACDAVFNAEEMIDEGGRIVIVAECGDGPGDSNFYDFLCRFKDPKIALGEVRKDFSMERYKALKLIKLREEYGISLVSAMPIHFVEKILLRKADTANEGLQNAFRFLGRESKIGVVVDGSSMAPCLALLMAPCKH